MVSMSCKSKHQCMVWEGGVDAEGRVGLEVAETGQYSQLVVLSLESLDGGCRLPHCLTNTSSL